MNAVRRIRRTLLHRRFSISFRNGLDAAFLLPCEASPAPRLPRAPELPEGGVRVDWAAIASDWRAVGESLRAAMRREASHV